MTGAEWILQNERALGVYKIDPSSLSTELSKIEPATRTIERYDSDAMLALMQAPPECKYETYLEHKPFPRPSLKPLSYLSENERYIFEETARGTKQKDIGKRLNRTQGAVSTALKVIDEKLKRLKIVLAYDFTEAIASYPTARRQEIVAMYLSCCSGPLTCKSVNCSQGFMSTLVQELKHKIPAEVWAALNPKRPIAAYDCQERDDARRKANSEKATFLKAVRGKSSGIPRIKFKRPKDPEQYRKMAETKARKKAALKALVAKSKISFDCK